MARKTVFILILFATIINAQAQLYIGSDANSLFIKSGETFHYDGLALTPSADFTLANTTLTRTDARSIIPTPPADYVARYFSFSNTTPAFSGTVRFSYAGATLTPLAAGSLELNIRTNGSSWTRVSGTDASGSSYVTATVSSSVTLNTFALASNTTPLPVTLSQFTGVKNGNAALLSWTTASEYNTQDFLVQHSPDGQIWRILGAVKAAGNSNTAVRYGYTHHNPGIGYNYYRLIQRDRDGNLTFTGIATVLMGEKSGKTSVYPNPVQNHRLTISIAEPTQITLFDAAGRRLLSQNLKEGEHTLDVSGLQGGMYYLHAGAEVLPIIIP